MMTKVGPREQCPLASSTDPDSQPSPQPPPAPMGYSNLLRCPDQDLTLTPDKQGTETGILKRGRGGKQAQRQVRFRDDPKSKAMSVKKAGVSGEEPVIVTVIAEPPRAPSETQTDHRTVKCKGKKNVKKKRGSKAKVKTPSLEQQPEALDEVSAGVLCEGAELNTTLALRAELDGLTEAAFDPKKAVQEQLKKSTHTKNNIAVKATEGVNIPRSQNLYRALVSVNVSEDQLISQALQDRLMLVPPTRSHSNQESPAEGPNILAFFNPGITVIKLASQTGFLNMTMETQMA
ncbi:hypothetical protein MATL_G00167240 [Megalops atlanticus]|uniref:Protein phosphatase 1 regulatory subunit 35 C-terminal domain-containing protein n=1 Tax=Megalops atlanticus TaxID=7932 RepID=A0A9D3T7Q2_MEGAT|nr:hypothetical protein MATL_G00167240 [Megalops atlanticus]